MPERECHPVANIFPLMSDEELQELAADIKANGLQTPIELLDGKILDGRNRYLACEIAQVTPRVVHVNVKNPLSYVLSRNLHRRHLTVSQRAMIAARARELFEEEARNRQRTSTGGPQPQLVAKFPQAGKYAKNAENPTPPYPDYHGKARDLAGRALGVSGKTVDAASKVLTHAAPDVIEAVDAGKLSVSAAAKAVDRAKATPADEAPKDADGRVIPEHLREVFRKTELFDKFAQVLSTLKGQVRQAIEADPVAWSQFSENRFQAALDQAHDLLKLSGPFIICSYCGGDQSDKCRACKGSGFLNRAQTRCVPQELRRCN